MKSDSLADIIEKLGNLKTPSEAFVNHKLINSARFESLGQYTEELYEHHKLVQIPHIYVQDAH